MKCKDRRISLRAGTVKMAAIPFCGVGCRVGKSRATRGTDLGLAIAANIAHAHKGSIKVSSTVGEGTTFTVQLPIPSPAVLPNGRRM